MKQVIAPPPNTHSPFTNISFDDI